MPIFNDLYSHEELIIFLTFSLENHAGSPPGAEATCSRVATQKTHHRRRSTGTRPVYPNNHRQRRYTNLSELFCRVTCYSKCTIAQKHFSITAIKIFSTYENTQHGAAKAQQYIRMVETALQPFTNIQNIDMDVMMKHLQEDCL